MRVGGTAVFGPGVGIEEHGDGIPVAQEFFWHDAGAVGALNAVEIGGRALRLGARRRREEGERHDREQGEKSVFHRSVSFPIAAWPVFRDELLVPPYRVLAFFSPALSRNSATTSSGGPIGGGERPSTASRTTLKGASAGMRASTR